MSKGCTLMELVKKDMAENPEKYRKLIAAYKRHGRFDLTREEVEAEE